MTVVFDPYVSGRKDIEHFELYDANGTGFSVTNYGARLTDLRIPDKSGCPVSVILGFPSLADYLVDEMCFGALVGPVAGRIAGAQIFVEGKKIELSANDGSNLLHGGRAGFQNKVWDVVDLSRSPPSVRLRHTSPEAEGGFPGNLTVEVFYCLSDPLCFLLEISGQTDQPTPFSPTNHAYFNLSGGRQTSIASHQLKIMADLYTPFDSTWAMAGEILPVSGKAADCREFTMAGDFISSQVGQHGENYVLGTEPGTGGLLTAAELSNDESGIGMTVKTTAACLQFYGGEYIPTGLHDQWGRSISPRGGLCLECQEAPFGASCNAVISNIITPDSPYTQTTLWQFRI